MLRVTPIYGSTGHNPNSQSLALPPTCTLIEYGGVKVLINVGHDESQYSSLNSGGLEKTDQAGIANDADSSSDAGDIGDELPEADVVLLTDSSLQSLGGLPMHYGPSVLKRKLKKQQKKSLPKKKLPEIYGTFPTLKMGQMTLYDHHANVSLDGGNPGFSLNDVDALLSATHAASATQPQQQSQQQSMKSSRQSNKRKDMDDIEGTVNKKGGKTASEDGTNGEDDDDEIDDVSIQPVVQTLKYSQTITLYSSTDDDATTSSSSTKKQTPALSITPHRAGHLIGASYFILKRLADETEVVVAPIYHHAKEKHLDCSTLHKYGTACDVLITMPGGPGGFLGALYSPLPLPKIPQILPSSQFSSSGTESSQGLQSEALVKDNNNNNRKHKPTLKPPNVSNDTLHLLESILSTLRRGGNVLLPTDTSGRVLELLYTLNAHWERHRLSNTYNLVWVGCMCKNVLEFVRSQLEWMAGGLGSLFDSGRGHPFKLNAVKIYSSVTDLEADIGVLGGVSGVGGVGDEDGLMAGGIGSNADRTALPTVVLASGATLDCGPARDLFCKFAEHADNAIILTDSRRCVMRGDVVADHERKKRALLIRKKKMEEEQRQKELLVKQQKERRVSLISTSSADVSMDGTSDDGDETDTNDEGKSLTGNTIPQSPKSTSSLTSNLSEATPMITKDTTTDTSTGTTTITIGSSIHNTENISMYSTASQLLLKWCQAKATNEEMADIIDVDVRVPHRAPLGGVELKEFLASEEAMRWKEKKRKEEMAMLREVELVRDRLRLNEQQDESGAAGGVGNNTMASTGGGGGDASAIGDNNASGGVAGNRKVAGSTTDDSSGRPRQRRRFDATLFLKYSKPCHMTFEVREEAVGIAQPDSVAKYGIGESIGQEGDVLEDDYGISIKPDHFSDIWPSYYGTGRAGGTGPDTTKNIGYGFGFGADGAPHSSTGASGGIAGGREGKDGEAIISEEEEEQAKEVSDLSEGTGIIRGRNNRPPMKVSTVPRQVEVEAEILFVPFEGRVDASSARQSVRALQPRQVVILGGGKPRTGLDGTDNSTNNDEDKMVGEVGLLADSVRSLAASGGRGAIFAPSDGEAIELSVGHAAYSVRLVDTPFMTAEEKEAIAGTEEEQISYEPYEAKVGDCTVSLLDYRATGQTVKVDGSIVLAPKRISGEDGINPTVMVSDRDVLLTDMRSEVIAQGMKAEYSAHVGYRQLIVNGKIVVRQDQVTGEMNVEGPLCEDFFTVRSIVQGQYVTL